MDENRHACNLMIKSWTMMLWLVSCRSYVRIPGIVWPDWSYSSCPLVARPDFHDVQRAYTRFRRKRRSSQHVVKPKLRYNPDGCGQSSSGTVSLVGFPYDSWMICQECVNYTCWILLDWFSDICCSIGNLIWQSTTLSAQTGWFDDFPIMLASRPAMFCLNSSKLSTDAWTNFSCSNLFKLTCLHGVKTIFFALWPFGSSVYHGAKGALALRQSWPSTAIWCWDLRVLFRGFRS